MHRPLPNILFLAIAVLMTGGDYVVAQQWTVVPSPSPSPVRNILRGVGSISPNDVWAVGTFDQQPSSTLTEHWNGTNWTVVPSPNPASQYNELNAVVGLASNDVYAVGNASGVPATPQMVAMHWNGSVWSVMNTPVVTGGSSFDCVLAFGPNDIYAGGYKSVGAPGPSIGTLVAHWNGSRWDILDTPNQSNNRSNFITDMKGISANDIWAAGYSKELGIPFIAMILHKSGSNWSVQSIPNVGLESFLYSIEVISANDIWATGEYNNGGSYVPLFMHYNGSAWTVVSSPGGGAGTAHNASNDIWSSGSSFVHYNGSSWATVTTQMPSDPSLGNIAKISSSDMWTVGRYDDGILKTLIMHYGNSVTSTGNANQNPGSFALHQNYPNPFNPSTNIRYQISEAGRVKLNVFDMLGREVATVVNENFQAGSYDKTFNAAGLSSGIYVYKLQAGTFIQTRKLVLLR